MNLNDVPLFEEATMSRTVKLFLEERGKPLTETLHGKPWCIAPGLIYSICKLDRSLVEAFKEEHNIPDCVIRKFISNALLFDIPNTEFKKLSCGRELLIIDSETIHQKFLDFCTTLELRGSNMSWRILAANVMIRDPIRQAECKDPDVRITVLCPYDEAKGFAYAPEYTGSFCIIPNVMKIPVRF